MNPLEEFLAEKEAAAPAPGALKGMGHHMGNALAQGVGAGVGGALLVGIGAAASKIYGAATAKRDFRSMMEWNRDLAEADQRLVTQSFRTVRKMAPDMSTDPLVAGSFVRQMVQSPEGAAGIMANAITGQKNMGMSVRPVRSAFDTGATGGMANSMKNFNPFGQAGGVAEDVQQHAGHAPAQHNPPMPPGASTHGMLSGSGYGQEQADPALEAKYGPKAHKNKR
jgi:hypothetical protein